MGPSPDEAGDRRGLDQRGSGRQGHRLRRTRLGVDGPSRGHEKCGHDGARGPVTAAGKGLRSGTIGLTGSVVIAVSSVAPAYSLAAVLAGVVAVMGAKTPALFVIGFLPMMLTALAFRELARQTPDCGSTFTWAMRAFGPWVGWLAGWAAFIAAVVAVGNGAQIAAIYRGCFRRRRWGFKSLRHRR